MEPIGASVLEPIAGSAFALNLIYIGLERFRYRQQIRDAADTHLKSLSPDGTDELPENVRGMKNYKQLLALRLLPNHSDAEIHGADKASKMPSELWGLSYEFVFRHHRDRRGSIAAAVFCAFILCVGVAEGIGTWSWLRPIFDRPYATAWFYAVIVAGCIPVFLAWLGKWVVKRTNAQAKDCLSEVEKAMAAFPRAAAVRDLPDFPRPQSRGGAGPMPVRAGHPPRQALNDVERARRTMMRQRLGEDPDPHDR